MTKKIRAAQYVRMSTEHQQYSTENQADVIREYAAKHGTDIVRTFEDSGKSGLRIQGRGGLQQLIETVQTGKADFDTILVYDVSRWGRFQNPDEGAFYEFTCERAGITVHYCAEQFTNDGTMLNGVMKNLKRSMAGEYSRELSAKVFKGQCRLIEIGYRQGGVAGYGLRRMLVDVAGSEKGILAHGEHKSIQTDRVILVPGPADEVETVRRIYRLFIDDHRNEAEIANVLNAGGATWSRSTVRQVLTNEKYIGHNVYNRVSFKLKQKRVRNPPETLVRRNDAFEAIVDPRDFYRAEGIILGRHRRFSDDEMLARLRDLLQRHGRLPKKVLEPYDVLVRPVSTKNEVDLDVRSLVLRDGAQDALSRLGVARGGTEADEHDDLGLLDALTRRVPEHRELPGRESLRGAGGGDADCCASAAERELGVARDRVLRASSRRPVFPPFPIYTPVQLEDLAVPLIGHDLGWVDYLEGFAE